MGDGVGVPARFVAPVSDPGSFVLCLSSGATEDGGAGDGGSAELGGGAGAEETDADAVTGAFEDAVADAGCETDGVTDPAGALDSGGVAGGVGVGASGLTGALEAGLDGAVDSGSDGRPGGDSVFVGDCTGGGEAFVTDGLGGIGGIGVIGGFGITGGGTGLSCLAWWSPRLRSNQCRSWRS